MKRQVFLWLTLMFLAAGAWGQGTLKYGAGIAPLCGATGTNSDFTIGNGSWVNNQSAPYVEIYLDISAFGAFLVDDIVSIDYKTKKPGLESEPDFFLKIYTLGTLQGWYNYRLNAEPYFSNNLNAPSNIWNTWDTDPVTNQLTFFDANVSGVGYGFYGQPDLQDLQSGPINWNSYYGPAATTNIDYGVETVKYIVFGTGSAWNPTFSGNLDEIVITVNSGGGNISITYDFEGPVAETWVDDDWATNSIGDIVDGHVYGYDAYSAIKHGIDATNNGGIVNIAGGIYVQATTINLNKSLTLSGEATLRALPLIRTSGTSNLFNISAANVKLENLEIEKTDDNVNQNIIYVGGNNFEMDNCEMHAQFVMGDGEVTRGFEIAAVTGLNIHNSVFYDLRQPAYINNATGTITDNDTYNTKGWVIVTESSLTFTGNTWGDGSQPNYYDIAIVKNVPEGINNYPDIVTMSDNNNDAIIENQHSTYSPYILSIVHVDVNTSATGLNGSILDPYTSINSAFPRVAVGGKIIVAAGTYGDYVSANKSCRMYGANAGIHPAVGMHPSETVGSRGAETIISNLSPSADNLLIDGFKFSKAGTRIIDTYANANNFTLRNCIVESTAFGATTGVIQFGGGSHTDCLFEFNYFQDLGDHTIYTGGGPYDGFTLQYNYFNSGGETVFWAGGQLVDGVIHANEIDGTIGGTPGQGFCTFNIGLAGNMQVTDNWVHDVYYTAFQLGIVGGSVTGNKIEDVYPYGGYWGSCLELWGGQYSTAESSNVTISDNEFYFNDIVGASNPTHAIRLRAPDGGSGIDGSTIHISNNKFFNGSERTDAYSIWDQSNQIGSVDAECNYWGTMDGATIAALFNGPVDYEPWSDASMVCGYVAFSNIQNLTTGDYFADIQSAIDAASIGDEIEVTGEHNITTITVNKGLKIAAGVGGAKFKGLVGPRAGTGFEINTTGDVIFQDVEFEDFDLAIDFIAYNTATVVDCQFTNNVAAIDNKQTATYVNAVNNWWGAANGPYDGSDDRASDGFYNPLGEGDEVSDYVYYSPWYNDFDLTMAPVDIGIINPSCAVLEVQLKSEADVDVILTNMLFSVAWDNTVYPGTVAVSATAPPLYGINKIQDVTDGNTTYAIFGADYSALTLSLDAGVPQTVLTLELDESGAKFATTDFFIAQDAFILGANGAYYVQLDADDRTGYIYLDAEDVYVGSCDLELDAKVFLQGPYNAAANEMKTDITGIIPDLQPFDGDPWSYTGGEDLAGSVPADMVDWVLVEARATESGAALEQKAGLLFKDGSIMDVNGTNLVRFSTLMPNNQFYFVVYSRNHMPVMTASAVNIPNASLFDLTDVNNAYTSDTEAPLVSLETGVYGMIAGDIYGHDYGGGNFLYDGKLRYSGSYNDRGPILARIIDYNGVPYINGVINDEYFIEDLTLNSQVKYSGAGNDPRLIIQNLIELKNSYDLNITYTSKVPNWVQSSPKAGSTGNTGPLDITLRETSEELQVNIATNETLFDALTDNIQFTLSWEENNVAISNLMSNYSSDFLLEPQGEPVNVNGTLHQVFAMVDAIMLPDPWGTGQEVTVMTFHKTSPEAVADKVSVAQDGWTAANNGEYYMSIWGVDRTGQMLTNALGISDPEASIAMSVYPNPVSQGYVNVTLRAETTETVIVTVTDISGRTVMTRNWSVTAGNAQVHTLDLQGLSKGAYVIDVKGTDAMARERIVVQ